MHSTNKLCKLTQLHFNLPTKITTDSVTLPYDWLIIMTTFGLLIEMKNQSFPYFTSFLIQPPHFTTKFSWPNSGHIHRLPLFLEDTWNTRN